MPTNKSILVKQTLLLVLISVLFYMLGFIGSYVVTNGGPELLEFYLIFYIHFFLMAVFFIPTSIFYFLRMKRNIKLTGLNITFRFFCWFLILILLAQFIFGIYMIFNDFPEFQLNIIERLWITIKYIDMDEVTSSLYYAPNLILAGLLYWTIRINKLLVTSKD